MLPKVRKSAQGCSKCKIVLQTQKSAQKVLSAIGKGLVVPHFSSRDSRASETRARVKITPRKKRRHAAGREKSEGLQTKPKLLN